MGIRQVWQITKQSFKSGYEYIGMLMLSNAVWFVIAFFPMLVITFLRVENVVLFFTALVVTPIIFGPATAGIHYIINKLVHREETAIVDFKIGFRKYFGRSLGLVLLNAFILAVLVADLVFSINHPNTIIRFSSGIWLYFIIFWYILIQYIFPLLVQQDIGVITIMKRAALLAMDNMLFSIFMALVNFIILVASLILAAPVLLFLMGLTAFVQNYALVEVMKKYESANGMN